MFCIPLKCMINYIGIEINGLKSNMNPKNNKESGEKKNRFRGLCLLGVPFSIRPLETNGNKRKKVSSSFFARKMKEKCHSKHIKISWLLK